MSSDIWHHHQPSGASSSSQRDKRSRSVLAMPNHSSKLSAQELAVRNRSPSAAPGAHAPLRPTHFGTTAVHNKQTIEDNSMSSDQKQPGGEWQSDGQQQAPGGKHAGPMGIFFKVWSLVKVTKGRHQQRQQQRQFMQQQQNGVQHRLRRQNSEDNSNYSADFAQSSRTAAILQDQHFRRAGSQPAGPSDRLQVQVNLATAVTAATTSSTGTSSGVSSTTSSTLAANSSNSPTTSSSSSPFRRRHFSAYNQQPAPISATQQGSWMTRMRRSANSNNGPARARTTAPTTSNLSSRRRHSGTASESVKKHQLLSLSLSTSDGSRSSSELRDEPEEYEQPEDEEEDGHGHDDDDQQEAEVEEEEESNDIYSTPNDSIQSVPSGQRALAYSEQPPRAVQQQTGGQAYPIIKSFSTNNFQQAAQLAAQTKLKAEEKQGQTPRDNNRQDSSDSSRTGKQRLSGSRFFISSSSSEDSQPTKQNVAAAAAAASRCNAPTTSQPESSSPAQGSRTNSDQPKQKQMAHSRQRVSVNRGVHCHSGPMRPQSLLLTSGQEPINQFLVPKQMLSASPSTTVYLGPAAACLRSPAIGGGAGYQQSPSLFEFPPSQNTRFSSKYPPQVSSFQVQHQQRIQLKNAPPAPAGGQNLNQSRQSIDSTNAVKFGQMMPNSISMYDFKQNTTVDSSASSLAAVEQRQKLANEPIEERSEYKLAEMMLESGSNPNARDSQGNTTLMLAVLSDNLPAVKCLIEHGANLNETNLAGLGPLDLVCTRHTTPIRLEMLKTLIDNGADLDRQRQSDGSRLLDRLIRDHQSSCWLAGNERMSFIECLLESGAKLSSSTWCAAQGKLEIQLSLLRKLSQDGYFLYKQSSIEASVYRFEYALKRIAELEQQLSSIMTNFGAGQSRRKQSALRSASISPESAAIACRKIKYQTYLGLSRCERRRKFYKRALEFAQLAILVDSSSYEAFYSKAHILKDVGEIDDSLLTIDQTARLIEKTVKNCHLDLKFLDQQEESLIMDTCFDLDRESSRNQSALLARNRIELQGTLDYLLEAKKFVAKLRQDIMDDKFKSSNQQQRHGQNGSGNTGAILSSS